MEKTKTGRVLCGAAAIAVIALAGVAVSFYGKESLKAGVALPGKQAEVEAVLLAKEASAPVITADMEMPLLTETGQYPEQEAAQEITVYDLTHEPEIVYEEMIDSEPEWEPAPTVGTVPVQPEPVPQQVQPEPAPQPVYTEDQQEGCVGDGLTW